MEWQDDGIVLAVRAHGETDAILSALTFEHGRHVGLVKGGVGRRARPLLQPGNRLQLDWRARLPEHLGHYRIEAVQLFGSRLVDDPLRLAALASATALLEESLAEREPHPRLYAGLVRLLEAMRDEPAWLETYVRFELLLLQELGFGLNLDRCAVTGRADDLAFLSPRTGRAVSREGAGDLAARLLPLPGFLLGRGPATAEEVAAGLRLTAHFLARHVFAPADRSIPAPRERLTALQGRQAENPS